jgi:hypothetical protein
MTKTKTLKRDWIVEATIDGTVFRFFYYNVTENTARLRTKRVQTSQLRRMGFTRKARKAVTIEVRPLTVVKVTGPSISEVTNWYTKSK